MELLPVDLADADAYMALGARGPLWLAVGDEAARQVALTEAFRWLQTLPIRDRPTDACARPFDECWVTANAEVALALHRDSAAVVPAGSQAGPVAKSQALGALQQSFFSMAEWKTRYDQNDHPLLRAFPWIYSILGCWLPSKSKVLHRVRS
ncbi:putative head-tail connector protein [Cyanophage S-2L]|nr:putative head-tail connector protein [Cyanophage S-2L]